jgi:DUF1365 family protein
MRTHLLEGRVRHRRLGPIGYGLDHAVWYAALDLDELDEVDRRIRLFSRNGRNAAVFRDADHLPVPATDVRADLRDHLAGEGIDPSGWRITLVTNLRILGYVFNPASFFLCRDGDGKLAVVVVEVHNTHGERHLYTLHRSDAGADAAPGSEPAARADGAAEAPFRAGMEKAFYVSPFLEMTGRYAVHVRDDADRLVIAINERRGDEPVLATSLVLRRRPMTDRNLLGLLVRHPLTTQRTIGLIHWHALRLWLRGARFRRHGDAGRTEAARGHVPREALPREAARPGGAAR